MAWVAVAVGGATAIAGAINANQKKQRNKGYIDDSYRMASQRLNLDQANARESIAESANARGLAQGGGVTASPIRTAMVDGLMKASQSPTTLGGQIQSDAGVQMGLERKDLDTQHTRAKKENKVGYINDLIGAGLSGVNAGANVYGAKEDLASMGGASADAAASAVPDVGALPGASYTPTAAPKIDRSAIHSAMLSATSFDGVHPNDPIGDSTSAWYTGSKPRLAEPDESNASFNVG